jgi:hypothetical protein
MLENGRRELPPQHEAQSMPQGLPHAAVNAAARATEVGVVYLPLMAKPGRAYCEVSSSASMPFMMRSSAMVWLQTPR